MGDAGFDSAQIHCIQNSDSKPTHPITTKALQQLGSDFGCIPLADFKLYEGPPIIWHSVPDIVQAHNLIKANGLPNFLGQRIPVKSELNISSCRKHLCNYFDQELVDLIHYGFPLGFDKNLDLSSTFRNHASAVEFAAHVGQYIQEELQDGALLGPLDHAPFDIYSYL